MDWFKDTQMIQLDITSYCNAACGTCSRFLPESDDLVPFLKQQHFDLDLFERLVTHDLKHSNVKTLNFNGNWGDFSMHPDLLSIVEIGKRAGLDIHMSTNGTPRTTKFWHSLAGLLGPSDHVIFCIDGTSKETNELYRRKCFYDKIIENMKAFNNNGGNSIWTMTAFNHNIHQISEAESIAKDAGCVWFTTRRSHEDYIKFPTHEVKTDLVKPEHIYKKRFAPLITEDIHLSEKQKQNKCRFYNEAKIQIDPFGTVWPCCYISQFSFGVEPEPNDPYHPTTDDVFNDSTLKEKLTLHKFTLEEILNNDFFDSFLPEQIANESLNVCQRDCGLGA